MSTLSTDNLKVVANVLLAKYEQGLAVATAGKLFDNVPTIHDFGNVKDDAGNKLFAVEHQGFGYFDATILATGEVIQFCGGGAMNRILDDDGRPIASWSALTPSKDAIELLNINVEAVIAELKGYVTPVVDTVLTPEQEIELVRSVAGDYAADQAEEYLEQHAPPPITLDVYESLEARLNQVGNDLAQLKAEIKALS